MCYLQQCCKYIKHFLNASLLQVNIELIIGKRLFIINKGAFGRN